MATTNSIELWERQPKESPEAWEAFLLYRNAGEKRHLNSVAQELHKSYTLIRRWKDTWNWEERVLAYDNELQKEELKKAKRERKEMNNRYINISAHLQKAVIDALNTKDFTNMSNKDIVSFVRLAAELERTARNDNLETLSSGITANETQEESVVVYVPDNGLGGVEGE